MPLPATSTFLEIADDLADLLPSPPPNLTRAVMLFLIVRQHRLAHGESDLVLPGQSPRWIQLRSTLQADIARFARFEDASIYQQALAIGDQADSTDMDLLLEEGMRVLQNGGVDAAICAIQVESTERLAATMPQYRFFLDEAPSPVL